MKGVTVATANGDYTVPSGQSWGAQHGPDGEVMTVIHDGPFAELPADDRGIAAMAASGNVIGQFNEVEAVYFTAEVTVT